MKMKFTRLSVSFGIKFALITDYQSAKKGKNCEIDRINEKYNRKLFKLIIV